MRRSEQNSKLNIIHYYTFSPFIADKAREAVLSRLSSLQASNSGEEKNFPCGDKLVDKVGGGWREERGAWCSDSLL